jgi:hypothetical protein
MTCRFASSEAVLKGKARSSRLTRPKLPKLVACPLDLHLHIVSHPELFQDFAVVMGNDFPDVLEFVVFKDKLEAFSGRQYSQT